VVEATAAEAARCLSSRPGLAWLDGDGSKDEGRFSYVASDPVEWLRVPLDEPAPLSSLARLTAPDASSAGRTLDDAHAPRWVGYVAYDAGLSASVRAGRPRDALALCFARYDAVLRVDHASAEAKIMGEDEGACARLAARLSESHEVERCRLTGVVVAEREQHQRAIRVALEQIAAGEIYQVNLARRWRAELEGSSLALFEAMRRASPVPFGFYLDAGDHRVLGRSMERYLGWERAQRSLWSRPIKGTIARSGAGDEDEARRLRGDTKERAEHSMIIDLVRNDLGRVADVGTVEVADLFSVEPYAALSHLVSTVRCHTREDVGLVELFEATFPPGSVTGTPKLRSMEVIEALEDFSRGVYTGAVGYVSHAGDAHFAVAIRTAVERAGRVQYDAGGGIVALSDAQREVEETELKARAFLDVLP